MGFGFAFLMIGDQCEKITYILIFVPVKDVAW